MGVRYGFGNRAARNQLYPALLLALFLFSAFRFAVGCDWSGYYNQYIVFSDPTLSEIVAQREPIWVWTIRTLNSLNLPYPWLNVVSSAVFFAGMHAIARRQPDPLSFLILLFPILIINMPMSGIRQGAAIGVLGFAFVAFVDRSLVRFVIFTAIAAMIHSGASIVLLMAPLATGKYTRARIMMAGVLALPGIVALLQTDSAELAVTRYVETGIDAAGAIFRLLILTLSGVLFFGVLRKKWRRAFPDDYGLVHTGALVMVVLVFLVPFSSVIGDRLGYFLIPIQAIMFARIPYLGLGKSRTNWAFAPYLVLILVFGVWTALSSHFKQCYLPYQTWLFGFPAGTF